MRKKDKISRKGIMRRGAIEQVFIFITAVVVIIATIFVAGKFIIKLLSTGCKASIEDFESEIINKVELYDTYGTRKTITMPAPCDAREICFIDFSVIKGIREEGEKIEDYQEFNNLNVFIKEKVKAGVKNNIFLVTNKEVLDAGYSEKIVISNNGKKVLCFPAKTGSFNIKFEGQGATVKISEGNK